MKFLTKQTTKISTLLLIASASGALFNPLFSVQAQSISSLTQSNKTTIVAEKIQSTGSSFTEVGKQEKTTGTVQVVEEDGKRYLVLSEDFSTPNGPDVFLILHRDSQVETQINEADYINVAMLTKFSGEQRYLIPDDVNLNDYQSVGVWCRQFNVTFAYAPLVQ